MLSLLCQVDILVSLLSIPIEVTTIVSHLPPLYSFAALKSEIRDPKENPFETDRNVIIVIRLLNVIYFIDSKNTTSTAGNDASTTSGVSDILMPCTEHGGLHWFSETALAAEGHSQEQISTARSYSDIFKARPDRDEWIKLHDVSRDLHFLSQASGIHARARSQPPSESNTSNRARHDDTGENPTNREDEASENDVPPGSTFDKEAGIWYRDGVNGSSFGPQ
ncbi:uncharacterized protein IL334_005846 [Kwoniella shivajii]|uniref:Uncharacterized protein n=1 Tax=Kwoniella shivajii TaxID=564305 RepID=A0ABZ1D4N7_9TREE|nr:hypothetical protein IL334_005846 [Kwoniella shivajii]